ncbi:MAG: DUF4118 domain-containing protein [Longimicrobiaceae bacterium]
MPRAGGRSREALGWAAWLAALAALTAAMAAVRGELDKAHVALGYLLLVLAAGARGPRTRGFAVALLAFLCFNAVFIPPYGTLAVHDPRDWLVLATFLAVAGVAAHLLSRAQREAAEARRRAEEVARLSVEAGRARALAEADRLKDALIASVSHDLRTPLTTIKAAGARPGGDGRRAGGDDRGGGGPAEPLRGRPAGPLPPRRGRAAADPGDRGRGRPGGRGAAARVGVDGGARGLGGCSRP